MVWLTENKKIRDHIYNLDRNNTFAIEYKSESINIVKYATVKNVYKNSKNYSKTSLGEPYDIVCEIEIRKDPSADFSEQKSISYDPESKQIYLKQGVGRFDNILRINTQALEASYDTGEIYAKCDECGKEIDICTDKKLKSTNMNTMIRNNNGNMITPCCRTTNWKTKYRSNSN